MAISGTVGNNLEFAVDRLISKLVPAGGCWITLSKVNQNGQAKFV